MRLGFYNRYPLKVALYGGFASKGNLKIAKCKPSRMSVLPKSVV
jgi:hypothetical protein